jgi:hypothetical protein
MEGLGEDTATLQDCKERAVPTLIADRCPAGNESGALLFYIEEVAS